MSSSNGRGGLWFVPVVILGMLSVEAIAADRVPLLGWVANAIEADMLWQDRNIDLLQRRIRAPLLGRIPLQAQPRPESTADYLAAAGDLLTTHRAPA